MASEACAAELELVVRYRHASQPATESCALRHRGTGGARLAAAELRALLERDGASGFAGLRYWSEALGGWLGVGEGLPLGALPSAADPEGGGGTVRVLSLLLEGPALPPALDVDVDALTLAVARLESRLDGQQPGKLLGALYEARGPDSALATEEVSSLEGVDGAIDAGVPGRSNFAHLDLAVLSASPLVAVRDRRYIPLESASLDFKGELNQLRQMLTRTGKRVCARVDIASTSVLSEVLMQQPRCLYLVCHADYEPSSSPEGGLPQLHLSLEDSSGVCDSVSLGRLQALLRGGPSSDGSAASDDGVSPTVAGGLAGVSVVVLGACHSLEAGRAFVAAGCRHVVAIASDAKVLDDDAALFARHFLFALFQGESVRSAFERGKSTVASASDPRQSGAGNRRAVEADKIVLLPEGASHDERPMAALNPGEFFELNPLPAQEPPTVIAPFVGRALELQALVRMLRRRRQAEVRLLTLWGERGVGKSALGKAVAQFLWQRRFLQDGAAFVELAGVCTEAAALAALGDAIDMEFVRWKDASRALQRWQGVIVLDGVDELLEAAPAVVERMVTSLMHGSNLQVYIRLCVCVCFFFISFEATPLEVEDGDFFDARLQIVGTAIYTDISPPLL
ncbi:hypothetical protein T492DRAFT_1098481, partial [Pavlovales sp. CCMP2436]